MIQTFISHTSTDHQFVEWLKTNLEREKLGLDVFVDDDSVNVGDDPQKMIDMVRKSIIFIPILSNESIQKEFVLNEIRTALANPTTHIFPIKLKCDKENIPEEFKTKFISFDKANGKIYEDFSIELEWDVHYENLRRAIFNKIVELGLLKEDTKDFYQDCEHLNLILQRDEPTILEIKTVIDVYLKKESYHKFFLSKLTNVKWLKYLKLYGYLKDNPQPIEAQESPGLFKIPQWDALIYLERVSSQVALPDEVINDLLDIIKSISNFKDISGKPIDNYRTWYFFVKILINLPTKKISNEIINLILVWLDSKFTTTLPSSEISLKLLPKLLDSSNSEDWKKADRIIEIITDIKWVLVPENRRSVLEKEQEALTLVEPHWLKEAFKKYAERISTVCSITIIDTVAQRILDIFRRKYSSSAPITCDGIDYRITHELRHNGHWIEIHSSQGKDNDVKLQPFRDRAEFIFKAKIALDPIFPGTEFDNALSSIYLLRDYSYIWYKSLNTSTDEQYINDTQGLLTYILKELLSAKVHYDSEGTGRLLDKFLTDEYPYPLFKRFVLVIASMEWDKFKGRFFKLVQSEDINCFEGPYYEEELSVLLKANFKIFTDDEKMIIKDIISAGPRYIPSETQEPDKYKAYWKRDWFSLLKDDPDFAPLYEEQKKITGEDVDFKTKTGVPTDIDVSPLTIEEIVDWSNNKLASKMKEFRSEKIWGGRSVEGFATALKEAVKNEPNKFINNLKPFEDVGFIYVYKIFEGLKDSWGEKKDIDWSKVFEFIKSYIKREQFGKDEFIVEKNGWRGSADHKWVVRIIAELIQSGTVDDSWAFPEEYFEKAKEIIFFLLKEPEENENIPDYVTYALNTPCGNLITALVYLALRIARVNTKKGIETVPRWPKEYKSKFDEMLSGKVIEAFTFLGHFLPNLAYLDKEWVKNHVEKISSEKGSKYWESFMDGYLSIGKVYEDIYGLMKPNYEFGLYYDFKGRHNKEHLIQHICVAYLIGREDLDGKESLFKKIIDKWDPEQIHEIIDFFWVQKDRNQNEKGASKIIEFWRWVFEKYRDKNEGALSGEDKRILSDTSKLSAFLPQIDEESYKWLILSTSYINEEYNAYPFIEHLDELKNKGPEVSTAKYIGEIYLEMLGKITPDYDKAHIRSIVDFLYKAGEKENANKICNIYGSRGYDELLKDIYYKYSNK